VTATIEDEEEDDEDDSDEDYDGCEETSLEVTHLPVPRSSISAEPVHYCAAQAPTEVTTYDVRMPFQKRWGVGTG
jgi:hypothetical protein